MKNILVYFQEFVNNGKPCSDKLQNIFTNVIQFNPYSGMYEQKEPITLDHNSRMVKRLIEVVRKDVEKEMRTNIAGNFYTKYD